MKTGIQQAITHRTVTTANRITGGHPSIEQLANLAAHFAGDGITPAQAVDRAVSLWNEAAARLSHPLLEPLRDYYRRPFQSTRDARVQWSSIETLALSICDLDPEKAEAELLRVEEWIEDEPRFGAVHELVSGLCKGDRTDAEQLHREVTGRAMAEDDRALIDWRDCRRMVEAREKRIAETRAEVARKRPRARKK